MLWLHYMDYCVVVDVVDAIMQMALGIFTLIGIALCLVSAVVVTIRAVAAISVIAVCVGVGLVRILTFVVVVVGECLRL